MIRSPDRSCGWHISMTMHRGDHDLVGDRIEEQAEPRDRALRARQIAVEIIGDADQAVERRR